MPGATRRRIGLALLPGILLGAAACAAGPGDGRPGASPGPTGAPTIVPRRTITTVPEAVAALEAAVQDLYLAREITDRAGSRLVDRVEQSGEAFDSGDQASAFAHLQQAHAMIEQDLADGEVATERAALRLHRSIDLIGAVMVTGPPAAP